MWGVLRHRALEPAAPAPQLLRVEFIAPPAPVRKEQPPRAKPRPKPAPDLPLSQPMTAAPPVAITPEAAVLQSDLAPEVPSTSTPEPEVPTPTPLPPAPIAVAPDLALACPHRPAPRYPAEARRRRQTGTVVVRAEIDERGFVTAASIEESSGHAQLDDAAVQVIRVWRCEPPMRGGEPSRGIALQPFEFILDR
jgi:protein TonB